MVTEGLKQSRITSIRNVGALLTFVGALGLYVELGITADNHLSVLLRQDPLGFLAPMTSLLIGAGAVVFSVAADRSQRVARFAVTMMLALLMAYGVVVAGFVFMFVRAAPVVVAAVVSLFAISTLVGWIAGAIALARYCKRLADTP